jgi:uncharacterized protein (DUF302 family)
MTVLNIVVATFFISTTHLVLASSHGNHDHIDTKKTDNGLIVVKSEQGVSDTADKFESLLTQKGMTIFARIDHSAGAKKAGKSLRPTELIIFGNPNVGTPLMQCARSIAIDLPQKMLIWEDSEGATWLGYNDPSYLKERHQIAGCDKILHKIAGALQNFAHAAAK